jgi:hypothetical protein
MTFYLEPDSSHFDHFFDSVVDPIWLQDLDNPGAAALQWALNNRASRPPCWRVMHRVTYVSRVIARTTDTASTPVEEALHELDLDSNYELIRLLDPFVHDRTGSYAEFTDAVRGAVAAHVPRLLPHLPEVLAFLVQYYGVADTAVTGSMHDSLAALRGAAPTVRLTPQVEVTLGGAVELAADVLDESYDASDFRMVWSKLDGPGEATFTSATPGTADVRFSAAGVYRLRVVARAGGRSPAHADTTVVVQASVQVPSVTSAPG